MPFISVENNGVWSRGGTYTFIFKPETTTTFPENPWTVTGWDLLKDGDTYLNHYNPYSGGYWGYGVYSPGSGVILFNSEETISPSDDPGTSFEGAVEGLTIDSIVDLEDGTFEYTVTVAEDVAPGEYYLREAYNEYLTTFA